MTTPRVWNVRDPAAPADGVRIDRGTPWGNPFKVGIDGNRATCIRRFEHEVLPLLDLEPLRGRDLLCHCKPKACHGDPILRALYGAPGLEDDRPEQEAQGRLL